MNSKKELSNRRQYRNRWAIKSLSKTKKPRLSVFRSNQHIYAQIIDDEKGVTLASASSLDQKLKAQIQKGWNIASAEAVGIALAERAQKAGIKAVVFDRGPYIYHGRVKALAMGARSGGLDF
ncbi:MAG: 50S ribosomal protein L18 [Alphaproteobacteria bacterium RIFCSPLOWO2_01_FULL_45_8]|nr:MAG: 50S ribosomal protein L18 [Alphaproteobacteria bacterium GWB1_45_5]OFW76032.1 MAG: 50S ribosomal protein L18 [Alphaproteobacteria bacterium GWA1_45_9]OFW90073.1 MAG: 50S ribosomal protein L18 [Alphaproteobacteria bacterium RIFCSPHIGHO2_01_FULL_41_14]OFW96526.1 MAG: 50S ribosomal protein L18 [Alphaproteobacteria bacterium RIFCSPLOWO2_01_FULL_45_8]HCI48550.1 50S ribosomal protein L18 [Holosporales bacterium]